jgi:uncharacterized protein
MFTATEKKNLKQLLDCAVNKDEVLTLDGLHGYLYGLTIIPEPVMPSEWLPGIFGEEMLEVDSEEQGNQLLGSLFTVYNRMTVENEDGEMNFPFDFGTIKTKDVQRIREWARGFFQAISMRPYIWGMPNDEELDDDLYEDEPLVDEEFDDEAEMAACYAVVMGVAFPDTIPEMLEHDEGNLIPLDRDDTEQEAKLFAMLPDAVFGLQKYANGVRDNMRALRADNYPEPPKPRKVEKIGRNDPCPCGSSSKYKKCCGK